MKIFTSLLFTLIAYQSIGQITFQKNYRYSSVLHLWDATEALHNGYIFAGLAYDGNIPGPWYAYIVKTDSIGNRLWSKTYSSSFQITELAYAIANTKDGGYIVTGQSYDTLTSNALLLKINDTGAIQWSKKYGSKVGISWGKDVHQTSDGGFIILGDVIGGSNGIASNGLYVIKTDSLGMLQWTKTYNTFGDWGSFINELANNTYLIGGHSFYDNPNIVKPFLMNIDGTGTPLWVKSYGSNGAINKYYHSTNGDNIFGGTYNTYGQNYAPFILKMDSLYNPVWAKLYINATYDMFGGIALTMDNGYLLGGVTNGDDMIIKTNSTGNIQWAKAITRPSRIGDYPIYAKQLADTGYVLLGYTSDSSGWSNFSFNKMDSSGNTCFSHNIFPSVTDILITIDTFSFNIGAIDSMRNVSITASTSGYDTLICSSLNTSVTTIPSPGFTNTLSVFPNPTNGLVFFNAINNITSLVIYDITSKIILIEKGNTNHLQVNLKSYSKGVYFYKAQIGLQYHYGKLLLE